MKLKACYLNQPPTGGAVLPPIHKCDDKIIYNIYPVTPTTIPFYVTASLLLLTLRKF